MAVWKDYDEEQKKRSDEIFLQVALNLNLLADEAVHRALQKQEELSQKGTYLSIGQVLLKMRALAIDNFVKVNEALKDSTWICPACTTLHALPDVRKRGKCSVCNLDYHSTQSIQVQKPQIIGSYEILEKIARGGMGTVYKARHLHIHRIVALKVLHKEMEKNMEITQRFRREWEMASSLDHPHIVKVLDAGVVDEKHFLTMEYIEGSPLNEILASGKIQPKKSCEILIEIAQALHYAHQKGIVHRDIKPANILVDPDLHPHITDFGIAKALDHATQLTATGVAVGTLYYMSPEQARGDNKEVDTQSDLYSVGVVLFQMLSGRVPFDGETYMEVLDKIQNALPPSLVKSIPGVDCHLEEICFKAMSRKKEDRYPSCKELWEDLERYLRGEVPHASMERDRITPEKKKKSWIPLAVGMAALLIYGGSYFFSSTPQTSTPPGPQKPSIPAVPVLRPEETRRMEKDFQNYFQSGCSFLFSRNAYQAGIYFSKALSLFPGEIPSHLRSYQASFLRGICSQILNRKLEAQQFYIKAVGQKKDFASAHFFLAVIQALLGEKDKALESYQKAIQINPKLRLSDPVLDNLIRWDGQLSGKGIYWSPSDERIYIEGQGPEYAVSSLFKKTSRFTFEIYYQPFYEVDWTYSFAEEIYPKIEKILGISSFLPAFRIRIDRGPTGKIGYTETRFGEIRYVAGNWLPLYGCMELVVQTVTTQFLYSGISGDWPVDWWESEYGPFQAMVAVEILKEMGYPEVASRKHQQHISDPLYRYFVEITKEHGWELWKKIFSELQKDRISFYDMARQKSWAIRSLYLVAYFSNALGKNLSQEFEKAGLGGKPTWWDKKWATREFKPYPIDFKTVEKILEVKKNMAQAEIIIIQKRNYAEKLEEAKELFSQGDYEKADKILQNYFK